LAACRLTGIFIFSLGFPSALSIPQIPISFLEPGIAAEFDAARQPPSRFTAMQDLTMLFFTLAFFFVAFLYVKACEKLR
jgi:hypothetical protein